MGGSELRFCIKIFEIWTYHLYLNLNLIKQQVLIKMFGMLSILYSLSIALSSARIFEGLSLSKLVKLQHNLDHVIQDAQDILRKRSDHQQQMKNKGILEANHRQTWDTFAYNLSYSSSTSLKCAENCPYSGRKHKVFGKNYWKRWSTMILNKPKSFENSLTYI